MTEDEDSDALDRRNGVLNATDDALHAIEDAYFAALAARLGVPESGRDDYAKVARVLLAIGKSLREKDSAALGKLATTAREVLDGLGVDWTPALRREAELPQGDEDQDNVARPLLLDKDFAARARDRVNALLAEDTDAMTLGVHLARLVASGPWRSLIDSSDQAKNGERIGRAIAERIGTRPGTSPTRQSVTDAREVLRVALEALGATKADSRTATRQAK